MISSWRSLSTLAKKLVNSVCTFSVSSAVGTPCVACLAPTSGNGLCQPCHASLPANPTACQQCALPLQPAAALFPGKCGPCLNRAPAFSTTVAPLLYQFPIGGMIGRFKYGGQRAYGRPLALQLAATIAQRPGPLPEILIPVPMHPLKQRQRGFNQAEEIAHWLSRQLHIPVARHLLRRIRQGDAQSTLHRRQRLKNLTGAFLVTGTIPAHVALVDDVMTTGATAQELARMLTKKGARRVEIWVLARTPIDRIR